MEKTLAQLRRHGSACLCTECRDARKFVRTVEPTSLRKDDGGDDGSEGEWITINGAHVFINNEGVATKGPADVVAHVNNEGRALALGAKSVRDAERRHGIKPDDTVRSRRGQTYSVLSVNGNTLTVLPESGEGGSTLLHASNVTKI